MKYPISLSYSGIDLCSLNDLAEGWELDFIQLRPGKFSAFLSQFIAEDFHLGHTIFNCAVKQEGKSPEGVWTFAFINEVDIYWRNNIVPQNSIIIYAPGSEINGVSAADFEVMTFSISEINLRKLAKETDSEDFIDRLKSVEILVTEDSERSVLRRTIFDEIKNLTRKSNAQIRNGFMKSFGNRLIELMQGAQIYESKLSGEKRLKILHEAERIMLSNLTEHISVSDIASQLNVSDRTLLYTFKRRYDMGPKAYLKILKLNHVHKLIHKGIGSGTIASMARESGFWHMGQFHKEYKNFYGELPSETLKRATP